MENDSEGEDDAMPTIPGGDCGIGPKARKRDRFTSEMKDRQARGKDPMTGETPKTEELFEKEKDTFTDGKGSAKINYAGDGYEALEKRRRAMAIIDSPELLMMYAKERGDSIASSRYHLQHIMCGIEDERKPYKPSPSQRENVNPMSPRKNSVATTASPVGSKKEEEPEIGNENATNIRNLNLAGSPEP